LSLFPMFCPKCKETFEDGSRRFCPTDGSRLVPEQLGDQGEQWQGGIFASLLPKHKKTTQAVNKMSPSVVTERPAPHADAEADDAGDFFILEDIEPDATVDPILTEAAVIQPEHVNRRPPIRKVDPDQIPAGHVELGETDRLTVSSADFRADDPQAFIGRTVKGRYVVTEYFGGDESGYAFLADDRITPDRKVLLRILLRGETDDDLGDILDEERVSLSHFSHPNIARLIDSGQFTDGTRYLVGEYVDALSAADILGIHGAFDAQRAARVIRQAAYALGEAHQEGIVHRDLRPSNLIITPGDGDGDHVTLVNFGASTGEPTEATMPYKAPEILMGGVPSAASDIFSLGVVAFEMLTGRLPLVRSGAGESTKAQNSHLEKGPSSLRSGLSRTVDAVLAKALAFKAADRYATTRDFGDAFYAALTEDEEVPARAQGAGTAVADESVLPSDDTASTIDSVDATQRQGSRAKVIGGIGLLVLVGLLAFGWYYAVTHPTEPVQPVSASLEQNTNTPVSTPAEVPQPQRTIVPPPNSALYQNDRQSLRGDLLDNFIGFTMYYPKDWKVNGPRPGDNGGTRGKFIDISKETRDGQMQEQMLVSYYPSKGTFDLDADAFPERLKETNDTLKKLLPGYQIVSEGEVKVNGGWRAYEIKFQAGGASASGGKLTVWGRRLYIPAARPGVRNGFELTMLATSFSDQVRSVDDLGVRGDLASILYTFEPSQNF